MKWTRAVHHLETLAAECTRMHELPASIRPLPVVQLWTFGKVLEEQTEIDWARVALAVDLPVEEVPWLSVPLGATAWSNSTRLSKNPLSPLWRSSRAPIWNHYIVRPVLLWDAKSGVAEDAFAAIRDGRSDEVRIPEPGAEELAQRLNDELAISLQAMRDRVEAYEKHRWSPGKLTPVADELHAVTNGYLDLLDAAQASSGEG